MKRIAVFGLILIIFLGLELNSQSQKTLLAGRYIKLANTYLNAEDMDNTLNYLKKADEALAREKGWEAEYWKAATDEAYGTAFMKMRMPDEARKHFQFALDRYQRLINMKGGSPDAIEQLMASVESLMNSGYAGQVQSNPQNSAVAGLVYDANVLNFDNLKLRALPSDIPAKAINISLANNKFREFPSGLTGYGSLKYVNLANNRISEFNPNFAGFKNLVWLNLSGNKIKSVAPGISAMKNLEYLELSNNRLKDIPAEIVGMKSLKVLNLKGNRIPFARIKNLLQSMPNTNILHDEYVPKEEELDEVEE